MINEKIKNLLRTAIKERWGQEGQFISTTISENNFGDYASSIAFGLAKILKKSPQEIATKIAENITAHRPDFISKIEAQNGYVNLFLSSGYLAQALEIICEKGAEFGKSDEGQGQKVIIEFSQPNIAKPLHAGHLRNTILGEAIARIHDFLGYQTIRWNYIGDWGTQFGKVIAAYKRWGSKEKVLADPINELVSLYVRFNDEAKNNLDLDEQGQVEFKKLEGGDPENRQLWQWFRGESLKSLEKIYEILSVKFDNFEGESFYESHLISLISRLLREGLAQEGEGGALIIVLKDLPPALIRKSDGASLYLTRDIANLEYRIKEFNPSKILYVVDVGQSLHFQQLFAIAKLLGIVNVELKHLKYGLVVGEEGKKLSTRQGHSVAINEIIEKAVFLARKVVEEKNPQLSEEEKKNIAQVIGLGALKYEMLKDHRHRNLVFSWKRMLDFSGDSGPYLQYSYARLASIMAKAGAWPKEMNYNQLTEKEERDILRHLVNYPDVVGESRRRYITNNLALYLLELANLTNRFYEKNRILNDKNEARKNARLGLIKGASHVLKSGLALLGIEVLERV